MNKKQAKRIVCAIAAELLIYGIDIELDNDDDWQRILNAQHELVSELKRRAGYDNVFASQDEIVKAMMEDDA